MESRERTQDATIGESERWLSAIAGGMLVLSSLRRRDAAVGTLFALAGGALIFRGVTGHGGFFRTAGETLRKELGVGATAQWESAPRGADTVEEASMESFPASDAPSWTPTSSVGTGDDEA